MVVNEPGVNDVTAQLVERAVVVFFAQAPEALVCQVGQAGAKTVAQQRKQAKYHFAVAVRIGHDFTRVQNGLLFQQPGQDE